MKSCIIEGCLNNYYANKFCKMHYDKNRRNGNPTFQRKVAKGTPCKIKNCIKPIWVNGMCSMHNRRNKRHGDLNFINPKCNRDGKYLERKYQKVKEWKEKNWNYYKNYLAVRKNRLKQATPKWSDLFKIEEFYNKRPKGYHVDHIIPLNGKNVCGLHVVWNLQYLSKAENLKKSNKLT